MDETLLRRLVGATVLLLLAFGLASLLPGPDRVRGTAAPVVVYDLNSGAPLNLPSPVPAPPPVRLKPVQIGPVETAPAATSSAAKTTADKDLPLPKPEVKAAATPSPAPAATPATPATHSGRPALKVDESFGASTGASWWVQVGSFSSRENARVVLQKLFKQGLPAMMQSVTVGKVLWYRVRTGPYAGEGPAQQALTAVRAQGYASAKVVRPDAGGN